MQKIIVHIPRRKQKVRIIRTEDLINKELSNLPVWDDEIEEIIDIPEPEPEPMPEPEPEEPKPVRTVFTETFVISDSNQPIEISLKNIPQEESLPVSEVLIEVQSAYDRGFIDGQDSSGAAYESEISKYKDWIRRIDKLTNSLKNKFLLQIESLEKAIIPLSIMIAEHIIDEEIEVKKHIVINQVKKAINRIGDEEIFKIILHPDDIEILSEVKSELVSEPSKIRNVEISGDLTVEKGFCVLSTSAGIIDAKLINQINKIRNTLIDTINQPAVKEAMMIEKEALLSDIYAELYNSDEISG